jgi:hypothetical protein
MFVMVEKAPGAFTRRLACNDDVLGDIRMCKVRSTLS